MLAARYKTQDKNHERRATSDERRTRKAFTLLELAVAVGLLAMMILFASLIFNMSIDTYRMATASAEIMQKLQAITGQLNADFKGLRKDGEIFVVWVAREAVTANYDGYHDCDNDGYERFDRIMFFANGDFQSYGPTMVHGNLARISYMLAKNDSLDASQQAPEKRILARTQHILTADTGLPDFTFSGTGPEWFNWNNRREYDKIFLEEWKYLSPQTKQNILSVMTDVQVGSPSVGKAYWGANVNPADANSIHMLLCEGVGEFKVQGWYAAQRRWVPEFDPDGDGDLTDSDFFISDPCAVPGVLYSYPYRFVYINNIGYPSEWVDEAHFDMIPGLGRALKFTFTLYDSKGILKNGKTFTHIVYLGD